MAKNFQTIFTNLTNKFSGSAARGGQPTGSDGQKPQKREVLQASSKEELGAKTLQVQQNRFLRGQYLRMIGADGDKKLMYESNRTSQYIDYQRMEYYPIISAALDLLAEESTTIGQDGKMLKVYSSNKRIKSELENLFTNTLDLNSILQFWARNLPIKHDSIIPLLDGSHVTIKELSSLVKEQPDKEFWTYAIQDETQEIVSGKIVWCELTRKDETIYRVHLSNGTYIETSGDHEYLMRKGGTKKAENLVCGDNLMPYYNRYYGLNKETEQKVDPINVTIMKICNVISVEVLIDKHDVYCMEVQGPNGEHDRHNFPICGRKTDGTYDLNGSFVANCKYGDNFVYLLLDEKRGIIGAKQLTNVEVERVEEIVDDELIVKFKYEGAGIQEEYATWQIAHFRLLGDDRRMPYGMSVLDKIRRTFKMLTLFEDSMMVYRITRAAERRIFKVDVGDMPEEDVEQFVDQVARSTKSTKLVDEMTGDFNWKYNVATNDSDYFIPVRNGNAGNPIETLPGACLSLDTRIPLLDGRTLELNEIISEHEVGKELWVYTINPNTGEVVPGPITWAGVTRTNTQVLKITLGNGAEIISTPDHKFEVRGVGIKEAQDLKENDLLYAFQDTSSKIKYSHNNYHMVYDHAKEAYVYTHQMVAKYFLKDEVVADNSSKVVVEKSIHHIDFNHLNNNPSNLIYFGYGNEPQHNPYTEPIDNQGINIVSIEYLSDLRDTGTITVDGNEEFHNFHNFALASGVFTQNSNLSDIGDVSYLRDNLFTGLGIPKAFLGFSDGSGGEGKALSMLDIRFARKVNKIQQSLISELNKIAMIHLSILGGDYREHLDDFTLTLANPSTQSELLKIETLKAKFDTFEQATRISDNGTKAWSEIRAKREILGMSDEEIMDDLQEQMIEAKIGDEIKASGQLIRSSGLFDKLIKYKNAGFLNQPTTPNTENGANMGGMNEPMGNPMGDPMGGPMANAFPDINTGGGDPLSSTPLNEKFTQNHKHVKILRDSKISNELYHLVNTKESRLISENVQIEDSINRLIDELENTK